MRPKRIILVRHAESEGNADNTVYSHTPDYAVKLTKNGELQAADTAAKIAKVTGREAVQFFISPYWRTRQTAEFILKEIPDEGDVDTWSGENWISLNHKTVYEDPRLREQEYGHYRTVEDYKAVLDERDKFGLFYYRLPDGESGADCFDRASAFLDTLHREFEKATCATNIVIVTHGMMMRAFLMRWFRWSVESFESVANPKNGEFWILEKGEYDRYKLIAELGERIPKHNFQYDSKR